MILPLVVVVAFQAASPDACPSSVNGWHERTGTIAAGPRCGVFVGATDRKALAFSYGSFLVERSVTAPYEFSLTWRRLSPDHRAIELQLLGAILLFKDDQVGLWVDDQRFTLDGWRPAPGYRIHEERTVRVVQRARDVEAWVDGVRVGRWELEAPDAGGRVGVALKGAPGARATLRFADVSVRPLGTPR